MLRLSLKRFSFILSIQMSFLICDVVLNSVGPIFQEKNILKFIFFFQDGECWWLDEINKEICKSRNDNFYPFSAFLLLSLAFLVYSCYSTYIYQAGLTSNKQDWQFRLPVLITLVYILLSVAVHILTINNVLGGDETTNNNFDVEKSKVFVGLFILQKICELMIFLISDKNIINSKAFYFVDFRVSNQFLFLQANNTFDFRSEVL